VAPPRPFPPEIVADVMTRMLVAAGQHDTIESVEVGMKRFRVRHLPVVDGSNRLVGLVTRHDLLRGPPEAPEPDDGERGHEWDKGTTVGTMMRRDVLTTRPSTPLVQAGKALLQRRIGCLPVIEDDNTLVGIITKADFLKLALQLLERR
jgi:CBS domain-containing membrane protein